MIGIHPRSTERSTLTREQSPSKEDPLLNSWWPTLRILCHRDLSQLPCYSPAPFISGIPRGKEYNRKAWQNPQMNQTASVNND